MVTAILTQGSVSRGLLNLTVPMILGISSSLVAAVFETYLLGLLGTNELAAYSFTFPVVGALTSVGLGLSIGLSSVLARTVGAGDHSQVTRLATDGVTLMALLMFVITLLGLSSLTILFTLMGADQTTLPLIQDYMTIWYLGLIFFTLPSMGANALRATGDARISGTIMVAGAVMQMIIDPILILGLFGFPKLGIQGAAWAMLISRFVLCVLTFYVLIYRKHLIVLAPTTFQNLMNSWKQILSVGIPATATNLIGPVSTAIIITMLAGFGKEAVAGFGIASRLEALSIIPLFALSASIGPFVGQNWGANRRDRANRAMKYAFLWSISWGLLIAVLFALFGDSVSRYFEDDDAVIKYTRMYLMIVPISYGAWGVLMMASATFNSLGKPLSSTTMSVVRMFAIYVPLAYFGQLYWGAMGIFGAACLSNLIMGLVGYTWNRRTYVPMLAKQQM
ncbi:MAG: MATE family efflux transporter [bacterium]|nr:MATE family efflux transporter [Gammaproteobacteria bacterium]HIL95211.1 MATE family efflux transporter [Pseudomonadales bacterium]